MSKEDFLTMVETVTVDRTHLSEACINNSQIAADGLEVFGGLPHHVPITSSFIKLGQSAQKNYCESMKERKRKLRKESRSNKRKMKKSKFRKKKEVRKRNWPSEEQASLFSVFLSRTKVNSVWTCSPFFSLSSAMS